VVHPQFWPHDLAYADKKVIIIGSGATAVTLLPALCENGAAHVTMLQRSPGYFLSLPGVEPINNYIRKWVPSTIAYRLIRLRFLFESFAFVYFCRIFPKLGIWLLRSNIKKELPPNISVDPHFIPSYRPFEQRMCITPDGDFFQALRSGKADIVTDHIETVTDTGIKLRSGQFLDADIIITATGLKVQMCGNTNVSVNGEEIRIADKFLWRGAMLQDVPNLAFIFGYTNASWTLGSDAAARLFVRLLKNLRKQGVTSVVPRINDPGSVKQVEMMDLSSSYIQAALERKQIPKGGDVAPWKPRRTYFVDSWFASFGDITTGLTFDRVST
jgi:cation diffusion facilitator CzcD-associated flavoprotein CzcO